MLYLHDVWVNWFEGEENGYNVCYYHEWRKSDKIELLDQVPLLYINKDLYDYIENDMSEIPRPLLNLIHKRAFIRKGQSRTALDYACIITDGHEIIAFDTIGYEIPIRKSRLIPRQEQLVFDLLTNKKSHTFKIPIEGYEKNYHILSMEPKYIFGLTRRERKLKHVLMIGLDQLKMTNNIEELRYWLTEWKPKKYPLIKYLSNKEVWEALYNGVKEGWGEAHEELGAKLVKGYPFLEKMWELELSNGQDTSKLR